MMLMGDEYGHTRYGNNNSYGHDTHINNFQWGQVTQLYRFSFSNLFNACNSLKSNFSSLISMLI